MNLSTAGRNQMKFNFSHDWFNETQNASKTQIHYLKVVNSDFPDNNEDNHERVAVVVAVVPVVVVVVVVVVTVRKPRPTEFHHRGVVGVCTETECNGIPHSSPSRYLLSPPRPCDSLRQSDHQ